MVRAHRAGSKAPARLRCQVARARPGPRRCRGSPPPQAIAVAPRRAGGDAPGY